MLAPNGKPSKLNAHQWHQVRTPEFKAWFGDWEAVEKSRILNGDPVSKVSISDVPKGGYAVIEDWAASIFAKQGGKAHRDGIGEIILDHRSAKSSMAHSGANNYKKAAFMAAKDVIERGALVWQGGTAEEDSLYFSAPVEIDGRMNIETVLVHRDVNTKRMYLHSVTTKENLLNQRVSSAGDLTPKRSGSIDAGGIHNILHDLLNFNRDTVSKVVDPETGEPMVVYHGTTGDRTVFIPYYKQLEVNTTQYERDGNGDIGKIYRLAKSEPELHFFSEEEGTAITYGEDVVSAFLNIRNPSQGDNNYSSVDAMTARVKIVVASFMQPTAEYGYPPNAFL